MERLQNMLMEYNLNSIPFNLRCSWSEQYCRKPFPKYWELVFGYLSNIDKSCKIVEIGCGQGDITSIACYLGFRDIKSYERDNEHFLVARDKIATLFGRFDVVRNLDFANTTTHADILIIVNCAYSDETKTKEEYKKKILDFYQKAGSPQYMLLEIIDISYIKPDENFPSHIRLSGKDISDLFPNAKISSVETYKYPQNKRTKRLYIIER